ncbi:polysaccharide export outer membrane protein [Chitinophaga sp. CF118]|uniref:polysaccharide biosynthesis/export family protein n=1 Tax=Chitinophaga sp. CF118 TaxID=1884367 RepID=UPI0008E598CD|nr:polysaccharide biosynthesis/export family protein [Chitinophaga sp. CF118]SFD80418.1 polysaccharide export outer membrane protein [Chitinophaga sp. CF118]
MKIIKKKIIKKGSTYYRRTSALKLLQVGATVMVLFSCTTLKKVTYFRDVPDSTKVKIIEQANYYTPLIQTDDILQVTIQTIDQTSTASFNPQNAASWQIASSVSGESGGINGYLVDREGYVALPLVGNVLVKGKTTDLVREDIRKKVSEYFKDPVVNVRFANFKITVLGEVTRPSTYIMPNEKVTLLDALGAAGDLTIYGKRENVMLIREKDNKKELVRLNLNSSDLFKSPYYYLQQGDVVYVEPNKSKVASSDMVRVKNVTIIASILSLALILATRVRF